MGRKTTLAMALIALLQMHAGAVRGDEQDPREAISRAKAATALILDEQRFAGTAFCVETKGWFVTNRNALGRKEVGSTATLVLAPGETNQRVVQAEILRLDQEHDLALLKVEGDGFAFLPIGDVDELYETMRVTAFCYPMGYLSPDNRKYPSKNSHLIDTATMKAERIEWQGWKGGAWGPETINVSFDGSTAVVSGGGWAGIEVASILDGKIVAQLTGSNVQGEPLVAGNGALILPTKGGIVRRDLNSKVPSIVGSPFPAVDAEFSLAFSTRDGTPSLTLFSNNDPKPLATLPDNLRRAGFAGDR